MSSIPSLTASTYGLVRQLPDVPYTAAVDRARAALAEQGFGVLTEIDVQATLKRKLDADTRPYIILGACNPKLAHQALGAEPAIGLLLPCNVVISADNTGGSTVATIDPLALFSVVGREDIEPIAATVRQLLASALESIDGTSPG